MVRSMLIAVNVHIHNIVTSTFSSDSASENSDDADPDWFDLMDEPDLLLRFDLVDLECFADFGLNFADLEEPLSDFPFLRVLLLLSFNDLAFDLLRALVFVAVDFFGGYGWDLAVWSDGLVTDLPPFLALDLARFLAFVVASLSPFDFFFDLSLPLPDPLLRLDDMIFFQVPPFALVD